MDGSVVPLPTLWMSWAWAGMRDPAGAWMNWEGGELPPRSMHCTEAARPGSESRVGGVKGAEPRGGALQRAVVA